MSECEITSKLFLELHDGDADAQTRAQFNDHLERCPNCREDYECYQIAVKAMNSFEPVSPPPQFLALLSVRLDAVGAPSPGFFDTIRSFFATAPRMPLPAGVAALVFVGVLGFYLYDKAPTNMKWESKPVAVADPASKPVLGKAKSPGLVAKGISPASTSSSGMAVLPRPSRPAVAPTPNRLSRYSMPNADSSGGRGRSLMAVEPTVADQIGADNLTVESPYIDKAVESVKRMLPDLHGQIVKENARTSGGEVLLRVVIPTRSYADLTTNLINLGAVEAGAGAEVTPPRVYKKEPSKRVLHIRFIPPRIGLK
ncbi:zf-HC2 domain-containing protein [Thermodesulfobacteriota bacterium]